jgi:predicted unusual protein kinase regulating ubiquinone biosynthesis (AarF/ABC1/UbiB family)
LIWLLATLAALLLAALLIPVVRRCARVLLAVIHRWSPRVLRRLRLGFRGYTKARAIRLAFEDLGPTYVKFGQMIASSPSAFSEEVTAEFARCLDEVRPIPPKTVRRVIERELGRPAEEVFASIDWTPLASASVAQVHRATLPSGEERVIKVQRPGIAGRIKADLAILDGLARLAMRRNAELRRANLTAIVDDFRKTLAEELDFAREADNIEAFNALLERESLDRLATAPRVDRQLSTARIITMERLRGCRIDDKPGVDARREDTLEMLRDTSRVFWTCVFLGGFFHGDIHAGNIMVLDDGRLGYLDFGIFGRFDMGDREALIDWIGALIADDGELLARSIKRMGAVPDTVDWPRFVADVTDSFLPLRALTVDKPEMLEEFFPNLREMAARHDARLPGNFILILKQLAYFGRYVMLHEPSFNENLDPATQAHFMMIFARFNQLRAGVAA